jgi:hypothetical protein
MAIVNAPQGKVRDVSTGLLSDLSILGGSIPLWQRGVPMGSFRTTPDKVGYLGGMGADQFHNLRVIGSGCHLDTVINIPDSHADMLLLANHLGEQWIPHPNPSSRLKVLTDFSGMFAKDREQGRIRGQSHGSNTLGNLLHTPDDSVMRVDQCLEVLANLLEGGSRGASDHRGSCTALAAATATSSSSGSHVGSTLGSRSMTVWSWTR